MKCIVLRCSISPFLFQENQSVLEGRRLIIFDFQAYSSHPDRLAKSNSLIGKASLCAWPSTRSGALTWSDWVWCGLEWSQHQVKWMRVAWHIMTCRHWSLTDVKSVKSNAFYMRFMSLSPFLLCDILMHFISFHTVPESLGICVGGVLQDKHEWQQTIVLLQSWEALQTDGFIQRWAEAMWKEWASSLQIWLSEEYTPLPICTRHTRSRSFWDYKRPHVAMLLDIATHVVHDKYMTITREVCEQMFQNFGSSTAKQRQPANLVVQSRTSQPL